MRRELEPFKRQLAQGRRHLADGKYNDVSKYRREREDNQLLRPVGEVLGQSNNFESSNSRDKRNNDDDLLMNPNDYLEKQHIDDFTRKEKGDEMPQFLQPIDDLLERASNRHDVTEANRRSSVDASQSRNNDFLDYDLLMLKHKRAQEKDYLRAELSKFTSPKTDFLPERAAPVRQPASYHQLRSRHDDVMNAPARKMNSIEDDDELLLPCRQEVLKYSSPSTKTPKKSFDEIMTSYVGDVSGSSSPELLALPTTFDYKKHEEYFPFEERKRVQQNRERNQCKIPQNFDLEF